MWGKKKLTNTAAGTMDVPRPIAPPVIHNHNQTPWPGIILAGFACLIFSLPLLWFVLVFLFDQLGYRQPERGAAFLVVALPFGGAGLWMLSAFIGGILDKFFDYKKEVTAMVLEIERAKLLAAQSSVDGMRMNSADIPFAKLILAVMYDAFKYGPKGARGEIRWSRRYATRTANQHGLKLSQDRCGEVAKWLLDYNVINEKDEINFSQYPDLGSVKALASRVFNVPINFGDIGMTQHELHGRNGDQWGA